MQLLPHRGPVPRFRRDFQLVCVSTENSEMKVDWTVLIAPVRKSRCGAQAISHVHPRSARLGPRRHSM
jgi:hypothetical protein